MKDDVEHNHILQQFWLYLDMFSTFYYIINMSSSRKPEIQNDLHKITKNEFAKQK